MTNVEHRFGLAGAATAVGPTVVVDTFRAFSTAAYLIAAGAGPIILAETLDEARATAAALEDAILCGEDRGRMPRDFDLGNSPGEVLEAGPLSERTVVQRTSAGTRCVRAAIRSGAGPLFAASLVVASATAEALAAEPSVTIVASGRFGTDPAREDEATAKIIGARLIGSPADAAEWLRAVGREESADRLRQADWAHPNDLDLCLALDRFAFSMRAVATGSHVTLERRDPPMAPP